MLCAKTTVLTAVLLAGLAQPDQRSPSDAPRQARESAGRRFASAAHAAVAQGRPERALELLNSRVLQLSPVERHSVAGRAHLALGAHRSARRELTSAVRMRPTHAGDLHALAQALLACGAPAIATTRFEQAYRRGLDSAELHHDWAVALRSAGQSLGRIFRHELKDANSPSTQPGTFAFRGVVLGPIARRPGTVAVSPANSAIYHVCRALAVEPDRPDSLLLGAELWAEADRHPQAIELYERAAKQPQAADPARRQRGWANSLFALGQFDGYLKHARSALRLQGGLDSKLLARCYDRVARQVALRGEPARQVRYLKLASELSPTPDRLVRLADALIQASEFVDALAYLQKALDHHPNAKQVRDIQQRISRTTFLASPR